MVVPEERGALVMEAGGRWRQVVKAVVRRDCRSAAKEAEMGGGK